MTDLPLSRCDRCGRWAAWCQHDRRGRPRCPACLEQDALRRLTRESPKTAGRRKPPPASPSIAAYRIFNRAFHRATMTDSTGPDIDYALLTARLYLELPNPPIRKVRTVQYKIKLLRQQILTLLRQGASGGGSNYAHASNGADPTQKSAPSP